MNAPPVRSLSRLVAVPILALITGTSLAHASRVRPVNLEQMTQRADRVFAGRCVDVRTLKDPELGQVVTQVTFAVQRRAKGDLGGTVTIKLLGELDMDDRGARPPAGLPGFRKGEEVVLFLYGDSRHGLTAPVGLGQGKFTIVKDPKGRPIALNGRGNQGLLAGLSPEAEQRLGAAAEPWRDRRDLPSGSLLDMVERLERGERGEVAP